MRRRSTPMHWCPTLTCRSWFTQARSGHACPARRRLPSGRWSRVRHFSLMRWQTTMCLLWIRIYWLCRWERKCRCTLSFVLMSCLFTLLYLDFWYNVKTDSRWYETSPRCCLSRWAYTIFAALSNLCCLPLSHFVHTPCFHHLCLDITCNHPQNWKHATLALLSGRGWAMATGNTHRNVDDVWTCRLWDMHVNRQTYRNADRSTVRET